MKTKTSTRDSKAVSKQVGDLLYQALETEMGGVEIYRQAILCARNADLKKEWKKYLKQTEHHVEIVHGVFEALSLDPEAVTPGRLIVRDKRKALLAAMAKALKDAPEAAQIVAAECIVDAETKDHHNWELIGILGEKLSGEAAEVLSAAFEEVEGEEDEHLYHTKGWTRELWLEALGLPAQLPPPEEKQDVKTGVAAARVEEERNTAVKRSASGKAKR